MRSRFWVALLAVATVFVTTESAFAAAINYVIRATPIIQANNTYVPGATEFIIDSAGDKAAIGLSDVDGAKLGQIALLAITRWDDESRFTGGSGPAVAPYLNFWITDGLGNFAVAANEPSDANFQPLYNNGYNLTFADLANKTAKIFENNDKSWLPNNGVGLTFADLANYTILAPTAAQLAVPWLGLGTGAPRDAANNAYGVNWVFGDTLSNYVSGNEGYVVSGAAVRALDAAPVPEPTTLLLLGSSLLAARGRKLLRKRSKR